MDLLAERGGDLHPLEIKSGQTIAPDFFHGLNRWKELAGKQGATATLVYGGEQRFRNGGVEVIPWRELPELVTSW